MPANRNPVPARVRGEGMLRVPGAPATQVKFVKGTAPSTTVDLEHVIRSVREGLPGVNWLHAPVTHASDDDGLWF
jgi:hypothetical protein